MFHLLRLESSQLKEILALQWEIPLRQTPPQRLSGGRIDGLDVPKGISKMFMAMVQRLPFNSFSVKGIPFTGGTMTGRSSAAGAPFKSSELGGKIPRLFLLIVILKTVAKHALLLNQALWV